MEKIKIQDNSGDKKYFTIIPNYIANHSTANDQALYFQMKKITGEQEAICYASEKYFKDKLKIGSKALKKSFQYLLEHKWIEDAGIQEISTKGGVQKTKVYLVKDIWKLNIEYYQGVSESEPLNNKGVFKRKQRGAQKEAKGVAFEQQRITYNNNLEEEHTCEIKEKIFIPFRNCPLKCDDCFIKGECFGLFWQTYPRRENKVNAEKAWRKLQPDAALKALIIEKLKIASEKWKEANGKYIPHPTTWLNGRRWEDEIINHKNTELKNILIPPPDKYAKYN